MDAVCKKIREFLLAGDSRVYIIHWKTSRTRESDFYTFYVFHNGIPIALDALLCARLHTRMGERGVWIQHRIGENPVPFLKTKIEECLDSPVTFFML
jgi:hypothetical protein